MKKIIRILFAEIILCYAPTAFAQIETSNARSLAMGGAYTAAARGIEAAYWNPANLGLRDNPSFSMSLLSIGAAISNNSFSKNDYDLYNGAYLTPPMKTDILGKIPDDGFRVNMDSEIEALGFSWRHWALSFSFESAAAIQLSRAFADVALNGNPLDKTFDFSDSGGEGFAVSIIGVSYGRALYVPLFRDFAIGATMKYVIGVGHAQVIEAYGVAGTTYDGAYGDARAKIRFAEGGRGIGSDLGIAAAVNDKWTLGLTLRNWLSTIRWNEHVEIREYAVATDSLTVEAIDESSADSLVNDRKNAIDGSAYSRDLPAELSLGAAYRSGKLLWTADYAQGFSRRPGVSSTPQLAMGAEYSVVHALPLRVGFSVGGHSGFSAGLGVGVRAGTFEINFAANSRGGILARSMGGFGLAFGMRVGL
jgi:hypothetical protein